MMKTTALVAYFLLQIDREYYPAALLTKEGSPESSLEKYLEETIENPRKRALTCPAGENGAEGAFYTPAPRVPFNMIETLYGNGKLLASIMHGHKQQRAVEKAKYKSETAYTSRAARTVGFTSGKSSEAELEEDADDSAHLTERAEELQFITHTEKAKMMKDQVLKKGQGVTFDVLKPQSTEAEKECPSYKLVPEVVREESMHYYEVPRLGSYLAIKLEYESCLHAESFDKGLKDYKIINDFNNDL